MNLFNKIPDNFFSILSSKNKNIYGIALVTLFDCLTIYRNRIRKSDYLNLLKSRGEKEILLFQIEDEDYDDTSIITEPTLGAKANLIVRRLIDTGWILIDTDLKTGCEYILLPSYSISMLKIIYEFISDNENKYVSYVHATFADLQYEDETQDEFMYRSLVNAVNKTKDLELEVSKLNHSIRVFHKQLQNIFTPNEVLTQHFDIAREDVVDPIYHPLKTNDSIILYNGPINFILKRWLNTISVREKLIDQALIYNHSLKTREEAINDIIKKVNFISDTYTQLASDMEDIDKAQSEYTIATTEKVIYLNNSDKTIKGKLETIFLALAKVINGEENSQSYQSVIKDVNNSINLYQQGYIDEFSLQKPYRRSNKEEGEPLPLDDFEHEANEGLMESLLNFMDQYSDERIMDFMDKAFKDQKEIKVEDIQVKNVEDFIMVILGSVKATDDNSFYSLKRSEPMERIIKEEKYDMPNYGYIKKGE